MSKKTIIAAITIAGILLSLVGMQLIEVAYSNPMKTPAPLPILAITSPNGGTYHQSSLSFATKTLTERFEPMVNGTVNYETIKWIKYSLDGAPWQPLNWTFPPNYYSPSDNKSGYVVPFVSYTNITLTNLSEGEHVISVAEETTFNSSLSDDIPFVVDTHIYSYPSPYGSQLPSFPPSPFPSQSTTPSSTPSPNPTPTLSPTQWASYTPTTDRGVSDAGVYVLIAIVFVALAVGLGLSALVYFKKRKK